jgi:hypothetical protein
MKALQKLYRQPSLFFCPVLAALKFYAPPLFIIGNKKSAAARPLMQAVYDCAFHIQLCKSSKQKRSSMVYTLLRPCAGLDNC